MEALARWWVPAEGWRPPDHWIPVAEERGLIIPFGRWALSTVLQQIAVLRSRGHGRVPVAVNLSARQFQQKDLEAVVRRIVSGTGVDPTLVQFEITESLIMNDPEGAARILHGLRHGALVHELGDDDARHGFFR